MNQKQRKILCMLDFLECGLCLIAVMIFTLIFRLETTNIRYLFLMGDCYVIYSFSKAISSLESKMQKRVLKNKETKVIAKYQKKVSI